MSIFTYSPFGYEGAIVTVETCLRRGIPSVDLIGLSDSSVKETRERLISSFKNCGISFPSERVLISLCPADIRKEGSLFDLAIASSVIDAHYVLKIADNILVLGEVELSGKVRTVNAVHSAVTSAKEKGITKVIIPSGNLNEIKEIEGIQYITVEDLIDLKKSLSDLNFTDTVSVSSEMEDFDEVDGVYFPKLTEDGEYKSCSKMNKAIMESLILSACGNHNILIFGTPGNGKTLLSQKLPFITPILTSEESHSVTRIYSLSGLLGRNESFKRTRPFRMPHQTASIEGICGGGPHCRPGEITLSHNGTLFLDEAAEFRSSVLQMLRVPLESKSITLSRAGRTTVYPANFRLVMTSNSCPCGNFGSKRRLCLCSARSIEMYWNKFSSPLLSRIEIICNSEKDSDIAYDGYSTEEIRKVVSRAYKMQMKRQNKWNSELSPCEIEQFCKIDEESKSYIDELVNRYGYSPRKVSNLLKLSRTIADMDEMESISIADVTKAVSYMNVIPLGFNF